MSHVVFPSVRAARALPALWDDPFQFIDPDEEFEPPDRIVWAHHVDHGQSADDPALRLLLTVERVARRKKIQRVDTIDRLRRPVDKKPRLAKLPAKRRGLWTTARSRRASPPAFEPAPISPASRNITGGMTPGFYDIVYVDGRLTVQRSRTAA